MAPKTPISMDQGRRRLDKSGRVLASRWTSKD